MAVPVPDGEGEAPHGNDAAAALPPLPDRLQARATAPWLLVPDNKVVSIEHPCIVKDVDKALHTLGGEHQIKHLLLPKSASIHIGVSLRPADPLAKKTMSHLAAVDNVLLRITLPKRTGRKRKRGSDAPFESHSEGQAQGDVDSRVSSPAPLDGAQVLQRLREVGGRYRAEPVGLVKHTHRFRSMPDYQMRSGTHPVVAEMKRHLLHPSYASIKRFRMDVTPGYHWPGESALVPPNFSQFLQPMNYHYQQNGAVTTVTDEAGRTLTYNTQAPKKRALLGVPADIPEVPNGPPEQLPSLEKTNKYLQSAVERIKALFDQRPIITRRVAMNLIHWQSETLFKDATQYCGYSFRSGPWKDALVKFGLDPRKDPKYRFYQTAQFQLMPKDQVHAAAQKLPSGTNKWLRTERYKKDEEPSHVFDGKSITTNGKTWQFCDITDPILYEMIHTEDIRTECDSISWGWFNNGTMAKVRVIMRDKIGMMLEGNAPDENTYRILARIPDTVNTSTMEGCYFNEKEHGEKAVSLSSDIRLMVKAIDRSKGRGGMLQPLESEPRQIDNRARLRERTATRAEHSQTPIDEDIEDEEGEEELDGEEVEEEEEEEEDDDEEEGEDDDDDDEDDEDEEENYEEDEGDDYDEFDGARNGSDDTDDECVV